MNNYFFKNSPAQRLVEDSVIGDQVLATKSNLTKFVEI